MENQEQAFGMEQGAMEQPAPQIDQYKLDRYLLVVLDLLKIAIEFVLIDLRGGLFHCPLFHSERLLLVLHVIPPD